MHLHPVIPEPLQGTRTLTNFHYRDAVLSITVIGFGSRVSRMTIDGHDTKPFVPAGLHGNHAIVIELDNRSHPGLPFNQVESVVAPETPQPLLTDSTLAWQPVAGASIYQVYRDGSLYSTANSTSVAAPPAATLQELQIATSDGMASFLSEPISVGGVPLAFPAVPSSAGTGAGAFVILEQSGVTGLSISGEVPADGHYALAFRYANGSGPISTGSRCAVRTLFMDDRRIGPVVLPQRGADAWDQWGWSNIQIVPLAMGRHTIELRFLPADLNMSGTVNTVRIRAVQLERID